VQVRKPGRVRAGLGVGACLALLLAGCSLSPNGSAAIGAAVGFPRAIQQGDGEGACELLTSSVRQSLESSGDECATAVLQQDVPDAHGPGMATAFRMNAQVRLSGDVVFLSDASGRWLVTAAGCEPQPGRPYQCQISGG
jgi:hypothetical protein